MNLEMGTNQGYSIDDVILKRYTGSQCKSSFNRKYEVSGGTNGNFWSICLETFDFYSTRYASVRIEHFV